MYERSKLKIKLSCMTFPYDNEFESLTKQYYETSLYSLNTLFTKEHYKTRW